MRYSFLLVLLVAVLHIGCSQETLTEAESDLAIQETTTSATLAKTDTKTVPFKGSMTGHGWLNPARTDCPTGSLPLDAEGVGEATHLGEFEVFYEYCSYAQIDPTNPTFVGTATITAASGDQLDLTFSGMATGPTAYVENNSFVGGTGRFENVTGIFVHTGMFGPHPAGFTLDGTFEGEISSVGSTE